MSAIHAALRERYCHPEWAIFFEVSNGTGARGHSYADAVAMNLYPSRGLEINGFEVKNYRSDWLRELKDPAKAEPVFKFCDRWWIVAEKGLVKPGELPIVWGLIEHHQGKLRQEKAAPPLTPNPLNKTFAAALLRRAGQFDEGKIKALVDKEVERIRATERKRADEDIGRRTQKFTELQERVAKIKELTGIELLTWQSPEEIAAAIKWALSADLFSTYGSIRQARIAAEKLIKTIDEALPK
jgi:hypothetical protein